MWVKRLIWGLQFTGRSVRTRLKRQVAGALQKTFPPDWNSHNTLNAISDISDDDDALDESEHNDCALYDSNTDDEDDANYDERLRY
ncbi:Pentatricopeptide repeat-containing protein At5g04810, chloroplastic [Olea europaea subsp. europaea]|uniref:Pentatricopeptide repeat-containing protein At5g04810, chloroplastic n=1 Tax=Olea europaea subsp. europaea TaxID=158383 RepID=A0A8S0UL45_OLEEU|nr:Pentatricopeptide repeat-containing protein At5g04810, chloroplastic [Olea europaea subsp. europaea]